MDAPSPGFVCIGGAHIDIKAIALGPILPRTAVPVRTTSSFGGVARNIAEHLANLGQHVALISRVGVDGQGEQILRGCEQLGIDVSGFSRSSSAPTACCTFLLTADSDMFIGLAATEIYDDMTPHAIIDALPRSSPGSVWVMDTNLPEGAIEAVAKAAPPFVILAANAASCAKACRLSSALDRLDFLFVNRAEAEALTGRSITTRSDVPRAARQMLTKGAKNVVITLGAAGAFILNESDAIYVASDRRIGKDAIGAGDALIAGFLVSYATGRSIDLALRWGVAASSLAVRGLLSAQDGFELTKLSTMAASMASATEIPADLSCLLA